MRILLDTHTLLWWLGGDSQLSRKARTAVRSEDNEVYVSAASAWEISTKVRLGKLPGAEFIAGEFNEHLRQQGFRGLSITVEHGRRAGSLPGPHRDPFDRMLIAQSQSEDLVIISNEAAFDRYGVHRVW